MKKTGTKQKIIVIISIILITIIVGIVVSLNVIKINISKGKYNTANNNSSSSNLLPEYIKEGITLGGVTGTLVDLDTSDATATAMDITYGKTAYVDGKKIEGLFVARSSLKVGDYVKYTPDTAEDYYLPSSISGYVLGSDQTIVQNKSLKWQILSVNDNGSVDLVSDVPTDPIYIQLSLGYNNGVYIYDDIAFKQYSNKTLGIEARTLKIEDIEKEFNSNGKDEIKNFDEAYKHYGETYTYKGDTVIYPNLYAQENGSGINTTTVKKDGIGRSEKYYTSPTNQNYTKVGSNVLTVTQTAYCIRKPNTVNCFDNKNFYYLIFGKNEDFDYILSSRYAYCNDNLQASWGMQAIEYGEITTDYLCHSLGEGTVEGGSETYNRGIRPVVTINSNVIIYGGNGTEEYPYQLSK